MRPVRVRALILVGLSVLAAGLASGRERDDETIWEIIASNFRGTRSGEEVAELVDVSIVHGELTVEAERGRWNRTTEVATLVDRVRLSEQTSVVTCDSAVYWRATELAFLYGDVVATDGPFHATGDSAHVDRLEERVSLFGDARVDDDAGNIRADRIDYDRRSGVAVARGDVTATDRESGSTVAGARLVYNAATDLAIVTGDPELVTGGDENAPMTVHAEEMRLDRTGHVAEALRNVHIVQPVVQAKAGYAIFDQATGRARLTENPSAWDSTSHVTADTLTVLFEGREMRRLLAVGNVYVVQSETSGERAGERLAALGDRATAWFSNGMMDSVRIEGRAVSDYVPSTRDLAAGSGVNHARGERIDVYLDEGRASRVRLVGDAVGRYWFPPNGGTPADTLSRRRRAPTGVSPADTTTVEASVADTTEPARPDTLVTSAPAVSDTTAPERPRLLTVSAMLGASAETAAEPDSAASDSALWAARVRSLDEISPPDSLFPNGYESVTYAGTTAEFRMATGDIELIEEASVQYGDAWLRAGHVVFDTEEQVLEAKESPSLEENGSELFGSKMSYDVEARAGVVHGGRTEFDGGYYYGKRIKKLEDQTLLGESCIYTTCDREVPHFHFGIPKMKIELKKQVVGRPVVLYIANIPVLAVPYFLFPIQRGRRSGLFRPEIEFGFSSSRGRFVRNLGYYWAISDYADAAAWVDYQERGPRAWQGNFQTRYTKRYAFDGNVTLRGALNFPDRTSTPEQFGTSSKEWSLRASHMHDLPYDARLTLDAEFESSQAFREQQLGEDFTQTVDRLLTSNLGLTKSWSGASATLRARREQDLEAESGNREVSWTLPSFSFSLSRRTVGRRAEGRDPGFLPWLSTLGYSYSLRAEQPITEIKDGPTERAFALRHDASLTDTRSIGPFGVTPRFSYSEYLFEEDNLGRRWQRAGRWNAGASLNTTLYGTFSPHIGPLVALRHVIQPSASFTYTPEIDGATYVDADGTTQSLYPSVGGISVGNSSRSRRITLSVSNQFQLKVKDGEEERTLGDLFSVNASTSVNLDADERPWAPITTTARIRPANAFNVDVSTSHDVYGEGLRSLRVQSNLSLRGTAGPSLPAGAEPVAGKDDGGIGGTEGLVDDSLRDDASGQSWTLTLSHSYSRGADASAYTSDLFATVGLAPTKNWGVSYRANANLREKDIVSQSFVVTRNLHCWQASFERTLTGNGETYYFRIGVKDIPEIKYEQRR